MNQNSNFGVLLLMAVIALLFLLFLNKDSIGTIIDKIRDRDDDKKPDNKKPNKKPKKDEDVTIITEPELPKVIIEQLSMKTGKVVHRYSIEEFPEHEDGECYISISRPTATEGDIILDPACEEASSVSKCHLIVAEDEKGMYVVDNDSRHGTYINGKDERIEGTSVTNGLVLMLGRQPIRFIIPTKPKRKWFREFVSSNEEQQTPEQPHKGVPKFHRRGR